MSWKRLFDIVFAAVGLVTFGWLILICWLVATADTCSNGLFAQVRVGRHGRLFRVFKIKTMRSSSNYNTTITLSCDPRITKSGSFLRRSKLDELPQLWNVLVGDMSFVGPRPDVPGYADRLDINVQTILLSVRPGITGPASLAYRNEESILATQVDPKAYNDEIIYPNKVIMNLEYIKNWSFSKDLTYIIKTIFG
ncbi:sugar transferase [Burkholderiaceae bacterium]|nr:sugar transferase [Burkholderiaceae bacterium]